VWMCAHFTRIDYIIMCLLGVCVNYTIVSLFFQKKLNLPSVSTGSNYNVVE